MYRCVYQVSEECILQSNQSTVRLPAMSEGTFVENDRVLALYM